MDAFKALLGVFVYLITFAALATAGGAAWFGYSYEKAGTHTAPQTFTAKRGQGVSTIADNLETEGLINNALIFKIAARFTGDGQTLKAGEYEIPAGASIEDILTLLQSGKVILRQFTIREGLTSFEVVRELNTVDDLEGTITDIPPEGALLPETYSYELGDTKAAKLKFMQNAMTKAIDRLWDSRAKDLPYKTKREALIMASLIEKETGKPDEHARVAGVFVNRLHKGMMLQTDPTVIYAITKGKHKNDGRGPLGRRLLRKDLQIDSPYNTYKNTGLPPGPIANPGLASLKAALNPESHDYIFFVADGTGGHLFAKTLAEHNRNVAKWRKIRREQR